MQSSKKSSISLSYFFSGTFYTGLSSVAGLLVPILVVPYLIIKVGLENYGISAVAFSVSFFFAMIVDFGFNITGVNKLSKENNLANKTNIICNILYTKAAIFLFLLPILIFVYSYFISNALELTVYLFSLSIPFASIFNLSWALQGLHKIKTWSLFTILSQIFYVVLVYIFVKTSKDVVIINLFYGVGILISGIGSLIYIIVKYNLRFQKLKIHSITEEFNGSYHFFMSNIGNYTSLYFLGPLTGYLISYEMAGVYSIIEKIYNIVRRPFAIYQTFMLPKVSEQVNKSILTAKQNIKSTYGFVILFIALEILFLLVFRQEIISYFTLTNLRILNNMFMVSIIGLVLVIINCPLALYLTALDKKHELMKMALIAPLFGLALGVFLIKVYGIMGSIFTLIIIELFYVIYLYLIYIKTNTKRVL